MAIQKNIELSNYGVSANYWKISEIRLDAVNKRARITIVGYLNNQARDSGKSAIPGFSFDYGIVDEDFIALATGPSDSDKSVYENLAGLAYAFIKQKDEFLEGVDA